MVYSSSEISSVFDFTLLAKAAYKDIMTFSEGALGGSDTVDIKALPGEQGVKSYFSENGGLADYLGKRFDLVKSFEDTNTGFSAMLLRDKSTDEHTLTIRGTEFENEIKKDLLLSDVMIGAGFSSNTKRSTKRGRRN